MYWIWWHKLCCFTLLQFFLKQLPSLCLWWCGWLFGDDWWMIWPDDCSVAFISSLCGTEVRTLGSHPGGDTVPSTRRPTQVLNLTTLGTLDESVTQNDAFQRDNWMVAGRDFFKAVKGHLDIMKGWTEVYSYFSMGYQLTKNKWIHKYIFYKYWLTLTC